MSTATINGPLTPARMIARRKRLREALVRAEGDRRISLEVEIASITDKLAVLRAELEEAEADDAPADAEPESAA